MGEVGLGGLGVVERPVTHGAPRSAEGEGAAVKQVAASVPVLGSLVHDLDKKIKHFSHTLSVIHNIVIIHLFLLLPDQRLGRYNLQIEFLR